MSTRNRPTDERLDEMLGSARLGAWPDGSPPDTNPRVEAFLKEQSMSTNHKPTLKRSTIALIVAGVIGGGGLAAAVTNQILSRRATIITDDGSEYHVELLDTPEGAGGTWEMDDGTVYGINMIESGDQKEVTVDIDSPTGGTTTVMLDNGMTPTVKTAPGQKASISVQEVPAETRAVFIDEDGVEHAVDASAAETWVQTENDAASDEESDD